MRRRLPRRRAHVHRRRLQLRRADRRRRLARRNQGHSDALLGIFDAIAPAASAALAALAAGDARRFHAILAPTVPLSRHIFQAPTRFYKTGVVFMAWLNGHQDHFAMVGGQQSARSLLHFAELFRLADAAGLLERSRARACARMRPLLARARRRRLSDRECATSPPITAGSRSTPRRCAARARSTRSSRPARATASARISPWRDQVAGDRPRARRRAACATHGLALSGYCRGGMFPAADAAGRAAPRSTTTAAPSTRRRRSARPAWCWSSAACPARSPATPLPRTCRRAPRQVHDGIAAPLEYARASACRSRSSRCIRCTPPTAPASTRWRRRSISATRSTRRSGALGVAVDVYHVWWDPKLEAQIARAGPRAPARLPRLRLAGADHATCSSTAA